MKKKRTKRKKRNSASDTRKENLYFWYLEWNEFTNGRYDFERDGSLQDLNETLLNQYANWIITNILYEKNYKLLKKNNW